MPVYNFLNPFGVQLNPNAPTLSLSLIVQPASQALYCG
uniref:Uncharacterized protein n=1 Tax=Arundo donax TaxID=35708 RepID=A0A0A9F189_ARUDO